MASETIVAVFRTAAEAEMVASELKAAGVDPGAIEQHAQETAYTGSDATMAQPATTTEHRSGLWGWLLGEESYQDEHGAFDRAMSSGGVVLTAIVPAADAAHAVAIIEQHHPIDIDENAASGSFATSTTAATGQTAMSAMPAMPTAPSTAATSGMAATAAATTGAAGEVISLAEESLNVGKKMVNQGTAKIRRFVVERPVEEQIRLRTESLRVDRRPVSGDSRVAADAFTEKVVEVNETREEAVVGKTARVVEEVVIGKDVNERVETVHDTVRREEIEVVDSASATKPGVSTAATSATGTTTASDLTPSRTQAPVTH